MALCCDRLQNSLAHAGERGIATLVSRRPEYFVFYLQSRAVAFGDQSKLRVSSPEVRVNLDFTVGIQFCPWCGSKLEELAATAPQEFAELARRHEPFVPKI